MDKYKIYPKQYRNEKILIQKNKCFVLMQFSTDLDLVYGTIKEGLEEIGFLCNRADDISGSPIIFNKILTEMFSSRFVIAELSYNNPNVFYELGIAHSFKESSNIIIIKQKNVKDISYPFDLRHLQYIEYSPDNLKLLVAQIKQYIEENKFLTDFYEMLNVKGIIPFVSDNQEAFVEYLSSELGTDINITTYILNGDQISLDQNTVEAFYNHYENIIIKTISNNRYDVIEGILKIYFELLYNCPYPTLGEVYLNRFLDNDFHLSDNIAWKIELINKCVLGKKYLNIGLPWIVQYFSKLHATNIDLNRYKLERLLLTCNYEEVNDCIINALYSPINHIRESMADIIGEKRLKIALESLYQRLQVENGTYVSRSIVEAIGKIDDVNGIERLLSWFESARAKYEEDKYYGIYDHMAYAIQRMDTSIGKIYLTDFVNRYREKINIPGI